MRKPKISKSTWRGTEGSKWMADLRDAAGKRVRRFFATRTEAEAWADTFAKRAANEGVKHALLPDEARVLTGRAMEILAPFNASLMDAAKFYADHHRHATPKPVAALVEEFLDVRESRGASERYLADLRSRLGRFKADFGAIETCRISTGQIQEWLDGLKLAPQSCKNFRTVLGTLFQFAVARGCASVNPVESIERVKVRNGEIEIYSPAEIAKLLAAATEDFLPALAIGAFAGLRSAEIERLEWSDIHLAERFIVVGASKAKTAGRRIVPVQPNLAAWLAPHSEETGTIWKGGHDGFYEAERDTAAAVGLKWKANGLRHSYASYRFAQICDAGRVAGELGNSAAIVHRHYRELVKPADAQKWFAIVPAQPSNVLPLATHQSV